MMYLRSLTIQTFVHRSMTIKCKKNKNKWTFGCRASSCDSETPLLAPSTVACPIIYDLLSSSRIYLTMSTF